MTATVFWKCPEAAVWHLRWTENAGITLTQTVQSYPTASIRRRPSEKSGVAIDEVSGLGIVKDKMRITTEIQEGGYRKLPHSLRSPRLCGEKLDSASVF
jgi:hypothetical protein